MADGREANGRFAPGNPGGPGRPPRATERQYLRTLADAVPPAAWRVIVERAVADAIAGDAKARDWLTRYLLGQNPASLRELAVDELAGIQDDGLGIDLLRRQARLRTDEDFARLGL